MRQANESEPEFLNRSGLVAASLRVVICIVTHEGEFAYSQSAEVFDDDNRPLHIKTITLDSALLYKLPITTLPRPTESQ